MMDRDIRKAIGAQKSVLCNYCFSWFMAISDKEFCPFCELPEFIHSEESHITNSQIEQIGASFSGKLESVDMDGAEEEINKLIEASGNPILIYVKGIFHIKKSNYLISMISYTRDGFMEENARLRAASAKEYAAAREALHTYIYKYENAEKKGILSSFAAFLSYTKLGMRRPAAITLNKIKDMDEEGHLYKYAEVLMLSCSSSYKQLLKHAREQLRESPSHNAVYYLTYALLKNKKARSALKAAEFSGDLLKDNRFFDIRRDALEALSSD